MRLEPPGTPEEGTPAAAAAAERTARFRSLRDELRSQRRWEELLSPAERHRMLADIARVALAVGRDLYPGHELDDLDVGRAAGGDTCPRERLAFVAAHWPRLARALRRVEAAPSQRLAPGERPALLEQGGVRRATPAAILAALRTGDLVNLPPDAAGSAPPLARRLGGRLPRRMTEQTAAATPDTPENRAVKAILFQLGRDLGGIAALAEQSNAPDAAREAGALGEEARRHLGREPWASLPRPGGTAAAAAAAAVTTNPAYRLLFDFWRSYRRAFAFDWNNPLFTLPARETWQIYEVWCLFAAADALHRLGFRCTAADGFALTRAGLTFSLVKGQAAGITLEGAGGRLVTLTYSPTFPRAAAGPAAQEAPRSRSHAMRPDVAVAAGGSLLVLDAKFKTYSEGARFAESALLPDVHQMHAYRDAIRRGESAGVVRAAWLLYAGRRDGDGPAVTAYPPATPARPFGHGDVGAIRLRPGGDHQPLRERIALFLEEVGVQGTPGAVPSP